MTGRCCIPVFSFASLRLCARPFWFIVVLFVAVMLCEECRAADNELTADEQTAGWVLLFNGHDLAGWKNNNDKPVAAKIEDGAINVHGTGGYVLVYDKPFGDFVFKCDVKMGQPKCNSGVFVHISNLADPVQTGLEVQVLRGKGGGLHDFGAIYDLVASSRDARNDAREWDRLRIRCKGPLVSVRVNGKKVATIDCDKFDQPGRRPDGTRHKFSRAIKDFARSGYLGLQDHGNDVWYKNIKLREL